MKKPLIALFVLTLLALGAASGVHAQLLDQNAVSARIEALRAEGLASLVITTTLMAEGVDMDQVQQSLSTLANSSTVQGVMAALVELGHTPADAAALMVSLYSPLPGELKVAELETRGLDDEMTVSLLVALTTAANDTQRLQMLVDSGMSLQEAAELLVFFTVGSKPEDFLNAFLESGLSLTDAINIIVENDSTAAFEELLSESFNVDDFNNDALSGTAGGGVSTSE